MATSLVISLSLNLQAADVLQRYLLSSTNPRNEAQALEGLFYGMASGSGPNGSFTVQQATLAPVRASATATLAYASIANNDTVTVAGVVLTCVTGTPSGAQFKKVTDGPTTATNLAALINTNATTKTLVYATAAASVVTVSALVPGAVGNFIPLATSNGTGFVLSNATLQSGAGGAESVAISYSRG